MAPLTWNSIFRYLICTPFLPPKMASYSNSRPLHILLFPFLAHGHMIPIVDMAKLFADRRVKVTIVTTPLNEPIISRSLQYCNTLIQVQTINFHCAQVRCFENVNSITSPDSMRKFFEDTNLLQEPLEQLLSKSLPDCLFADSFFPWATDSAAKFAIPTIVIQYTGFLFLCASECLSLYWRRDHVSSDSEPFVIPNLPGQITVTRSQVPDFLISNEDNNNNTTSRLLIASKKVELKSYGVVVDSFYELEKDYADHHRNVLGRKSWHIGPLSLCNAKTEEKSAIQEHECFKWLDQKIPNSVVFICFGGTTKFPDSQLREIAMGLEASGQHFLWVVTKPMEEDEWLPQGFETRMKGKGLITRGWAPQVEILNHKAVGGFVTHCSWNSTLESVCAGVSMVTWPVFGEQFYNEKLVTEVLKIGAPVGVRVKGDSIKWEAIEKAVKRVMEGEEAEEMRNRAKVLALKARKAVEKGGSSHSDLNSLIQDLWRRRRPLEETENTRCKCCCVCM